MDCENLAKCGFFAFVSTYNPETGKAATEGFVLRYCKGESSGLCVRKIVSKALGGPQRVPDNMLPNGYPLAGTKDAQWSDAVKTLAYEARSTANLDLRSANS